MEESAMKKIVPALLAAALLGGATPALAAAPVTTTLSTGEYDVLYDTTTSFGFISSWSSTGPTQREFTWNFSDTVNVASDGISVSTDFTLPSFTLTPAAGYRLFGDLGGFIGNLVYTEVGGGTTDAGIAGEVSIDGGPGSTVSFLLTRTSTGPFTGYYSDARTAPSGDFSSLSFASGTLNLMADASTSQFAAIAAQPQNELRVSFNVAAVPEPATWLMFLSGVGVLGLIAYRRL